MSNFTKEQMMERLRKSLKEIEERNKKEPCIYASCELWADCSGCDGFDFTCNARNSSAKYKHEDGTWKEDLF